MRQPACSTICTRLRVFGLSVVILCSLLQLSFTVVDALESPCTYCKYCAFCSECNRCPCEESYVTPNCRFCKYCPYCQLCSACSICTEGGILSQAGGVMAFSTGVLQDLWSNVALLPSRLLGLDIEVPELGDFTKKDLDAELSTMNLRPDQKELMEDHRRIREDLTKDEL
eukprot:GFYU01024686.1.p1 GENE.GFYU01024686.1~~GFYU01024686.1.p1  ORF type:complete len:170 (+),score=18.17 GFYU01024686.1:121-630(+)